MKVLRLLEGEPSRFVEKEDLGELGPFSQESLLLQILAGAQKLERNASLRLVFSRSEEAKIDEVLKPVIGGLRRDQGHGHGQRGEFILLSAMLQPAGFCVTYVPANTEDGKPRTGLEKWFLAVTSL